MSKVHQNDLGGNLHGQDKIQQTTFFKKRTDYGYILEKRDGISKDRSNSVSVESFK